MDRGTQDDDAVIAAPFGRVRLSLRNGALTSVDVAPARSALRKARTAAGRRACAALTRYLRDPGRHPRARLHLAGTAFQMRVWRALQRIPAGQSRTYGALARLLGTSARAVGGACRANPVLIFVPCHRVVAAGGMGGFMGAQQGSAIRLKEWLLRHERVR